MTAFTFDAEATLAQAQVCQGLPNRPNHPDRGGSDGAGFGKFGRLGSVRAADPALTPELIRDLFEERATIREFSGGFPRADAERLSALDLGFSSADDLLRATQSAMVRDAVN